MTVIEVIEVNEVMEVIFHSLKISFGGRRQVDNRDSQIKLGKVELFWSLNSFGHHIFGPNIFLDIFAVFLPQVHIIVLLQDTIQKQKVRNKKSQKT